MLFRNSMCGPGFPPMRTLASRLCHGEERAGIVVPGWEGIVVPGWEGIVVPEWEGIVVPEWEGIVVPEWAGIVVPGWEGIVVPGWEGIVVPGWEGIVVPGWEGIVVPGWWRMKDSPHCLPQRGCALQPRVATKSLPWDRVNQIPPTPTGLRHSMVHDATLSGLNCLIDPLSQGSRCAATLGWRT